MSPRRRVPAKQPLDHCAPIFAALGDERQLRLIAVLCVWDHALAKLKRAVES